MKKEILLNHKTWMCKISTLIPEKVFFSTFLMQLFLGHDSFLQCHGFQHFVYECFMVHKVFLGFRKKWISKEGSYMLLSDVCTWIVVENWKGLDIHHAKNCSCSQWGVEKFWMWVSGNYVFSLKDFPISHFRIKLKWYRMFHDTF